MAVSKTGADALGIYLTTAADAVQVCDHDNSLGGFRNTTEVIPLFPLVGDDIPSIIIEKVLGANGSDVQGVIKADSTTSLTYTAPGGTGAGASVTITDGSTVLLMEKSGDGVDKGVRVTRDGSDLLGDTRPSGMTLDIQDSYNNVVAHRNVTDSQRTAGVTTYRAIMFYGQGTENITNLTVWQDSGNPSGIEIAPETLVSGAIQTVANETTAPTGRSWNTGTTHGTGVSIGSVNAGSSHGLWIRKIVSIGATPVAKHNVTLHFRFDAGGTTYNQKISGNYRIANDSLDRHEIYVGEDADPNLSSATATSATLPFSHALTPAGSDKEFRYTIRKRTAYDLTSLNEHWRSVTIDPAGAEVRADPTQPEVTQLIEGESGEIDIRAKYSPNQDRFQADNFAIYVRADGVDPTFAASERTLIETNARHAFNPATVSLTLSIGPYAKGADVRVVIRSHRSADGAESTNTTATAITISKLTPGTPDPTWVFLGGSFRQKPDITSSTSTTTIDSGDNVRVEQSAGFTDFLHGATLLMRLRWDSEDGTNNGLWTTFGFSQSTISGSPAEDNPISWDGTILYVHVDDVRRFQIDTGTSLISCASLNEVAADTCLMRASGPVVDGSGWHSAFQVLDACANNYETVVCLEDDGVLSMRVPWKQVAVVGDIP